MDYFKVFFENWGMVWIAVAGISAILGMFGGVRDKETNKITMFGKILLALLIISVIGAFLGLVAQADRSNKAQEQTIQILKDTRQSLVELSRILQPLDQAEVTLFVDLTCDPVAYEAFCSSAQAQANDALAERQELHEKLKSPKLSPGSSFSSSKEFDWSKWSKWPSGPDAWLVLPIFKTKEDFEKYATGNCLKCPEAGDLTLWAFVLPKNFSPNFRVMTDGSVGVSFLIKPEKLRYFITSKKVMSVPDLEGAILSISDVFQQFFEVLTPTTIFLETPKGQRITGKFRARETSGDKIFFAEFSSP
jgi:hypothetical protein